MPKLREPTRQEPGKEPEKALLAVQDGVQRIVGHLNRIPIVAIDGVLWKSSERLTTGLIAAGNNTIQHRLGRKPLGWFVVRCSGAVNDLYEVDSTTHPTDDKNITLNSTAGGQSVQIWFF